MWEFLTYKNIGRYGQVDHNAESFDNLADRQADKNEQDMSSLIDAAGDIREYGHDDRADTLPPCLAEKASFLNRISFWWVSGIIKSGYHGQLTARSLYELPDNMQSYQVSYRIENTLPCSKSRLMSFVAIPVSFRCLECHDSSVARFIAIFLLLAVIVVFSIAFSDSARIQPAIFLLDVFDQTVHCSSHLCETVSIAVNAGHYHRKIPAARKPASPLLGLSFGRGHCLCSNDTGSCYTLVFLARSSMRARNTGIAHRSDTK
jgi:hypothetical protein